jgi:hypothetical protein
MGRPGAAIDRRGVSTAVGYVLTLSVTTLLVAGLLIGLGGFVEDQREGTARDEMRVIGQQVASDLSAADRLARVGSPSEVVVSRQLPSSITGSIYRIEVRPGATATDPATVVVSTATPDLAVRIGVRIETTVTESTIEGGDFVVELNGDGDLEVSSA